MVKSKRKKALDFLINNGVIIVMFILVIYTGFTNDRSGVIPTGVILSVAPWAIAGVVILAGVVFFAIRSRKKYEEE